MRLPTFDDHRQGAASSSIRVRGSPLAGIIDNSTPQQNRLFTGPSTFGYSSIACAWITTTALGRTRIAGPAFCRARTARPAFGRAGIASAAGLRRAWIATGGSGLRTARSHQTDTEQERNDRCAKQPASGISNHCFIFLRLDLVSGRYTGFLVRSTTGNAKR